MRRALAILGTVILAALAGAGVVLSLAYTAVTTDIGKRFLVPRIIRLVDDAIEGSIELQSIRLLAEGGLELVGVRVLDADGDVVVAAERVQAKLDLSRIRSRTIGIRGEIDSLAVVLKREEDGSLSIERAFRPTHPSPKKEPSGPPSWTIRMTRLALRDGSVRYLDARGRAAFEAVAIRIDGRGAYGPHGARLDGALRGTLTAPERTEIALDVVGSLRDDQLRIRTLRASAGETALDAVAAIDTKTWQGKAAILALAVDAGQAHDLAPAVPLASDIAGTVYAESDGARASLALELEPRGGGGSAVGAVAARLSLEAPAAGVYLATKHLDLAQVLRGLPRTSVDLEAKVRGEGRDLASLRGAVALTVARSRVTDAWVGPVELRASADQGTVDVSRLALKAPGLSIDGRGRWRQGGPISARATVDANDLAAMLRFAGKLTTKRLPEVSGAVRLDADVNGTQQAPAATLRVASPAIGTGSIAARRIALTGQTSGPLASPRVALDGTIAALTAGGLEVRDLRLGARIQGTSGEVEVTGEVPGLGPDAIALRAAGALSADRQVLRVQGLSIAWPGDRFELEQPASVTLEGPSVDRLVLASGRQRIAVEGGIRGAAPRQVLGARARIESLDMALLPPGVVPASVGLAGRLGAELAVTGPLPTPQVAGRFEVADAAVMGLDGLSAAGQVAYDGKRRRASATLHGQRASGGRIELSADLPVALAVTRAGSASPVKLDVTARGWSIPDLLHAAKVELSEPVAGFVGVELHAAGTTGAPTVEAAATLEAVRYGDFDAIALVLRARDPATELTVTGSLDRRGVRALEAEAKVPLRLAEALRNPQAVARALPSSHVTLVATIPSFDLATVAGRGGVPEELSGQLRARAEIAGTVAAPRGTVTLDVSDVAYAGYKGIGAHVMAAARDDASRIEATVDLSGDELVRGFATLALPVERLGDARQREGAALEARLDVPDADLRRTVANVPVPVTGHVAGHVALAGALSAPRVEVDLSGKGLEIASHPLGELALRGSAEGKALHAELKLAVTTGGTLEAKLDAETDLSIATLGSGSIRTAPARARLVADQLDLGFLPAAAPGIVRSASGKLRADLTAAGPLARMIPRGTIALEGGQTSIAEFGEWNDIVLTASLSQDAFHLDRLTGRRGDGKLSLTALVSGVAGTAPADLKAELRTEALTVSRAGQDLATVDIVANLTGKVSLSALEAELSIPSATVRLPNRIPRRIQPLDERTDITIGKPKKKSVALAAAGPDEAQPYHVRVHVLSPGKFFVKGDNPRVNIELRADFVVDHQKTLALDGDVETVRGQVEPIGGRIFDLKRGRVHFSGEGYEKAGLEIQATYDNPTAKVNVAITGTIGKPEVKLTSEPAMDEAQIALLIATGQSQLKAGSGGVGTLNADEVSKGALGAVATTVFKEVVADKLPVDSVALDSSQIRAGKYVTDKVYVGYTRHFNANPEKGENTNEVTVQYQITPRWTFESRYGDAQSGGASVIWSRDY